MADIGNEAVFNEILQVEVRLDQFQSGLRDLETAYDAFLARISDKPLPTDVSQIINAGALQSAVDELQSNLEEFRQGFADSFKITFETVREELSNLTAAVRNEVGATQSTISGARQKARDASASWTKASEADRYAFMQAVTAGGEAAFNALTQQQQKWYLDITEKYARLENADFDYWQKRIEQAQAAFDKINELQQAIPETQRQAELFGMRADILANNGGSAEDVATARKAQDAYNMAAGAQIEALEKVKEVKENIDDAVAEHAIESSLKEADVAEKKADKLIEGAQRVAEHSIHFHMLEEDQKLTATETALQQAVAAEKAAATAREDLYQATGKLRTLEEEGAASAVIEAQRRVVTAAKTNTDARIEAETRLADYARALAEGTAEVEIVEYQRAAAEATRQANQATNALERAMTRMNEIEEGTPVGFFGRMFGQLKTDIPELLGNVVRFQLAWSVVGGIVNNVIEAIRAVPEAFHEGFEYLTQTQEKADELRGVLAANVLFSKDQAENFKIAGEAADELVHKLRDAAFQSNLNPNILINGFKAFIEGGGANFVNSMDEAVTLTKSFTLALQGAGKDIQFTRTLISELPQLLNSSSAQSSKLLEVFGLTKQQSAELVQQARVHHDLLARLEPVLRPYLDAQQEAALHQASLNEQIAEMKRQVEAALAKPLWDWWTSVLVGIRNDAGGLRDTFVAWGRVFGDSLGSIFQFGIELLKDTGLAKLFIETLKGIGVIILAALTDVGEFAEVFKALLGIAHRFFQQVADPTQWFSKEAWKKTADDMVAIWMDARARIEKTRDDYDYAVGNKQKHLSINDVADIVEHDPLYQITTGSNDKGHPPPKVNNDALHQLESQFQAELQAVQKNEDAIRKRYKDAEDAHTLSAQEATQHRIESYKNEADYITTHLLPKYQELAKAAGGKAGTQGEFANRLAEAAVAAATKASEGADKESAQLDKTQQQATEKHIHAQITLEQEMYRQRIQLAKESGASETQILALEEAAEAAKFRKTLDFLQQERENAKENKELQLQYDDEIAAEKQRHYGQEQILDQQRKAGIIKDFVDNINRESAARNANINAQAQTIRQMEAEGKSTKDITDAKKKLSAEELTSLNRDLALIGSALALAQAFGVEGKVVDELKKKYEQLNTQKEKAKADAKDAGENAKNHGDVLRKIFGSENNDGDKINTIHDAFSGFGNSVVSLSNAFKFFQSAVTSFISAVKQGYQQGGVLGAAGAGASQIGGLLSGLGGLSSSLPVVGGIMSIAGSVLSLFGGLFTSAAKHIAEQVKKEIDKTMSDLHNNTINLSQAITQLENERAQAIQQLSNKKGGKDQLNQILPGLDQQISDLKQQQAQIITQFEQQLTALRTHSETLSQFLSTWQQINDQVKQYIGAGGDLAKANEFLSDSLRKVKEDAISSLEDGEQSAIQDATKLNDLLTQRANLMKQEAQSEFNIINQDALERRATPAIQAGLQLAQQRSDYQTQLDDLNQQITLTTLRVQKEQQVFDLNKSIADLKNRSMQIELDQLDQEIAKWKDLKTLIGGIVNTNGTYGLGQSFGVSIGAIQVQVSGVSDSSANEIGTRIAGSVADELDRRYRYGTPQY